MSARSGAPAAANECLTGGVFPRGGASDCGGAHVRSGALDHVGRAEQTGRADRVILGIDPGLANTGWGVVRQNGSRLACMAYGCVSTSADQPLAERLLKIHDQIAAVVERFQPSFAGVETIWFGQNVTAAFGTGQARGAALVACAESGLELGEFTPRQIKLAVVGTGTAEKEQVQYMVRQLLGLSELPRPDHAADALAAAVCYALHNGRIAG